MPFRWMPSAANLVTLCGGASLVLSPSLDPLTPDSQAADGRPSTPVRFGAKTLLPSMGVRLNLLRNPGFEFADMSDWIPLLGPSERTTDPGEVASGSGALAMTAPTGEGSRYQDVLVPSGIPLTVEATLRGTGLGSVRVVVVNLDTGHFLDGSSGAPFPWIAANTGYTLQAGPLSGVYDVATITATVEPFATTRRYLTRLRFHVAGVDGTFADDLILRPWFNFMGVFGHNLTGHGTYRTPGTSFNYYGQVPRYDIDGTEVGWLVPGGASGAALANGSSYAIPTPNTWQSFTSAKSGEVVTFAVGSDQYINFPPVAFGELVIGYVEDLVPAMFPHQVRMSEAPAQIRNETAAGDVYVYNPGPNALREIGLRFIFNEAEAQEILREQLFRVTRGGADGIILVPPAALVSQVGCVFGLPAADFDMSIEAPTTGPTMIRTVGLTIRELPSPEASAE